MICDRCGTVFCWDEADEGSLKGNRKQYCSRACARRLRPAYKRHERGRMRGWKLTQSLRACARNPKPAYATEEDALDAITKLRRDPPLGPYKCPCGSWHLTSKGKSATSTVGGASCSTVT